MSVWLDLKHASVSSGSTSEPRWQPTVSTSAVGHVRVVHDFAVGLVMFLLACAVAAAVAMAWLETTVK